MTVPRRPCSEPGCGAYATYRGRCERHAKVRRREVRTPANTPIYNSKRWKIARRQQLFVVPLCEGEGCGKIATDVHHRIDLADGGAPFEPSNLESLCRSCHAKRTRTGQLRMVA